MILLTGSNGFVGRNVHNELVLRGQKVKTLDIVNSDYNTNLVNQIPIFDQPFDVVVHAAGKVHVISPSKSDDEVFFSVNFHGTKNLCLAFEQSFLPKSFIFLSSVAVYGMEEGENIDETYPLDGKSSYALSKIYAEQYLIEWCKKNNVILTILRPSLIAGQNPPGNLGKMISAINSGKYLSIRGSNARKSILMVNDITNLIFLVSNKGGVYNVCDSENPSFLEIEKLITAQLNKSEPFSISYNTAKYLAKIGDLFGRNFPFNSTRFMKITQTLTFSNEKAKDELSWTPLNVLDNFRIM